MSSNHYLIPDYQLIKPEIIPIAYVKESSRFEVFMARLDQIDVQFGGNKYYKLKYNLEYALQNKFDAILTFGGAFSNHIAATAAIGKKNGIKTIGIIRGEEIENKISENPTLQFATENGMELHFVTRADYKIKDSEEFLNTLRAKFPNTFIIPEGGTNELAIKGCMEIPSIWDQHFDFICLPVGTGGTIAGTILGNNSKAKIIGFPVLKGGGFLKSTINGLLNALDPKKKETQYELCCDYHFGGYAKFNTELLRFKEQFEHDHNIPLDYVYTAKMAYGVFDLMQKKYFPEGSKILMLHTGGLQGNKGWEKFNYSPTS